MINIISLLFLILITNFSYSQLVITNQGAPAATIVSGFIGSGLTISNPVISCPSVAYGTFSGGNSTTLGISNGILLTTGNTSQISGPAGDQDFNPNVDINNGTTCNDAEILAIESQAENDCCFLNFDVTPQCNELTIRFVFGSEEYPEFETSSFNDAFGFFI